MDSCANFTLIIVAFHARSLPFFLSFNVLTSWDLVYITFLFVYLSFHHVHPLVADVLQSSCDVNLFGAFTEPVQDHIYERIRAGPAWAVTG